MMFLYRFLVPLSLFCSICAVAPISLFGQEVNVDSLRNLIERESNVAPAVMVERLNSIGQHYAKSNPDSAIYLLDRSIQLSRDKGLKKALAKGLWAKAKALLNKANYPVALACAKESEQIYSNIGDNSGLSDALNMIGNVYKKQNDYKNAQKYYEMALEKAEKAGDLDNLAGININLGIMHDFAGEYPQAIARYLKALDYFEKKGDRHSMAMAYSNIGIVHFYNRDYAEAIIFTQRSNQLHRETGALHMLCRGVTNLGEIYAQAGKLDTALLCFQEADSLVKIVKDGHQQANIYGAWGSLYSDMGQLSKAATLYEKQIAQLQPIGAPEDLAGAYMNLGKVYGRMKAYHKATIILEKALVGIHGDASMQKECRMALAQAYAGVGSFDKAYLHQRAFQTLNDSILNAEKNQQLQELEAKYDHERQQRIIVEQKAAITKRNYIAGGSLALLLAALGGFFGLWQRFQNKRRQLAAEQEVNTALAQKVVSEQALNQLLSEQNRQLEEANADLKGALEQATEDSDPTQGMADTYISLTNRDKTRLRLGDILYVESKGNFVHIYTPEGRHLDWQQINHYEALLGASNLFVRTHRSFMANRLHITGRRATELTLSNGSKVPIASTPETKKAVHDWLDQWLNDGGHTAS